MPLYQRPDLAAQMARQLLSPGVLDEGLRSGLFLSGMRRTGKTTFLLNDLIPALEAAGAIAIYVDLRSDTRTTPAALVLAAVRHALAQLQTPASALLQKLKRTDGADVGVLGFQFGFKLEAVGTAQGPTLAQALTEVIDQAQTHVVLIVDEVQQAMTSKDGNRLLLALKAARDAINARPGTPGHFLLIGTGSHRALVHELTTRRQQAFAGATSVPYPVLGADYLDHLLNRLRAEGAVRLPSRQVALQAFVTLGHRPEEMLKALRALRYAPTDADPDVHLPVIAATLRADATEIERFKLASLGGLATAIFERIAATDGDARGLFSAEAAADYGKAIGREVRVEDIQPVVHELLAVNLIMRKAHGLYGITDPFMQEIWRENRSLSK